MEEDTGSLNTIQEDQDEVMQAGDSPTDVDSVIQNAAAKANLSVHNVKSILHVSSCTYFLITLACTVLTPARTEGQASIVSGSGQGW